MKLASHMTQMGRIVLFLMIIGHAGFTSVLDVCTMDGTAMAGSRDVIGHEACGSPAQAPVAGEWTWDAMPCHISVAAGGFVVARAILDPVSGSPSPFPGAQAATAPEDIGVIPAQQNRFFLFARAGSSSLHGVPAYLLNASLLI